MYKLLPVLLTSLITLPAFADMAHITADRDTTIIEDPENNASNGAGPNLFAGHTNQSMYGIRRALVRFDVTGALPEDAIIDRVFVSLYENSNNAEPSEVSLHKVMSDWGEAGSYSNGGSGADAHPDDTTWLHTFYDYSYWTHQGGDFIPNASATATVVGNDFYTFQSTNKMINNVRHWLHDPERNFGWVVMGDEYTRGSVKRFASRTSGNSSEHPVLTIEYHLPGQ